VYKNLSLTHEYSRISRYTHATKGDEEEFFHTLYEILYNLRHIPLSP
jgi:hypothetical protein